MFAKYNLELEPADLYFYRECFEIGTRIYDMQQNAVIQHIIKYLAPNGGLNASAIESDWFPKTEAHIFLSHSHCDKEAVVTIAGYLFREFGISCFIDSMVWGYADDLLRGIDDKYCVLIKNSNGDITYNYRKRNQSTTHIHMVLQGALAKMIDQCECLMFLNTPNSLTITDISRENQTSSPWIYSELLMANLIHIKPPKKYKIQESRLMSFSEQGVPINYDVNLDSFVNVKFGDIVESANNATNKTARSVLDRLYQDTGVMSRRD